MLIAPEDSGDVSDKRIGNEGDSHPTQQPCPSTMIFPVSKV